MMETSSRGELETIRIINQYARFEVTPYGAHILSYIPHGHEEVLWVSEKSFFEEGKPIRGGIPVCWPWFGPVTPPAHGYARISTWRMDELVEEADGSTSLRFSLTTRPGHGFGAAIEINVGPALTVQLFTCNLGDSPAELSQALHSYFAVRDINTVAVQGLAGMEYVDKLTDLRMTQTGPIRFVSETDRIYDETRNIIVIEDPIANRKIRVERFGCNAAVVWNPWSEKAKKMPDFGNDEFTSMLCVEAANAGNDVREIPPGGVHAIGTRISLL